MLTGGEAERTGAAEQVLIRSSCVSVQEIPAQSTALKLAQ